MVGRRWSTDDSLQFRNGREIAVFLFGVKEIPDRGRKYMGNVEL